MANDNFSSLTSADQEMYVKTFLNIHPDDESHDDTVANLVALRMRDGFAAFYREVSRMQNPRAH